MGSHFVRFEVSDPLSHYKVVLLPVSLLKENKLHAKRSGINI